MVMSDLVRKVRSTDRLRLGAIALALVSLALIGLQWMTDFVRPDNLLLATPKVVSLSWLESRYTYLLLHLATVLPILALSFDHKVHYYRQWRFLMPAILIVGALFVLWDVFFTAKGVWGFNHAYLLGLFWLGLPVEEWLFFATVPFACVFIYECLNAYFPMDGRPRWEAVVTHLLILVFLSIGFLFWNHMYTATTFLGAGFFLLFHQLFLDGSYRGRFYRAYLVSCIPFLLVNGVLTGGYTRLPVVIYNPEEYLGLRITSVPADDAAYSFLLILATITFYESFKKSGVS